MTNPVDLIRENRLVELTKTLVSIPSVTGQEHQLADWMVEHFKAIGLSKVQRLPVEAAADTIVGWVDGPASGPTLMLNFHLDTFDVFEGWQTDPFTPHLENGRLYGLGAHDMKGGGACILGAVEALLHSGVRLNGRLLVAATTDEENWSRGAHALIKSGLLENCQYCLVPEPSRPGTLTIGQRGRHVFRLTFHGKTVHAAYEGGINAVADAARVVALLANRDELDLGYNPEFDISGSLCVIGFQGGGTLILVPELAHVFIDRHILPGQTVEEAAAQIRAIVERANIASTYDLAWDERPTPAPPPFIVPPGSHFAQTVASHLAAETGQEIKFVLGRSVADTNHFAIHGGIPTLICGPRGGNTCQANEYVEVASLAPIGRTYVKAVVELVGKHK
jgi:acetylornithine deacetylase/succinyl-diaminopimelate desuccinylase-like protein